MNTRIGLVSAAALVATVLSAPLVLAAGTAHLRVAEALERHSPRN